MNGPWDFHIRQWKEVKVLPRRRRTVALKCSSGGVQIGSGGGFSRDNGGRRLGFERRENLVL